MSRQGRKRKRGAPPIDEPRMFHGRDVPEQIEQEPRFSSALHREGLNITPISSDMELMVRKALHAKTKKRKQKKSRLPDELFPLPNPDKDFHEKWYVGRNLLDFPHPFRMIMCSVPNGGKTHCGKHIILRVGEGHQPFERIYLVHCLKTHTKEYDDLDVIMLDEIPDPDGFDGEKKTLVILEDLDYLSMSKEQQGRLERLYGAASTHLDISVMLTAQNIFNVCSAVRRCSNIILLWNNHDGDMIKAVARKMNIDPDRLNDALQEKCQGIHDSIWIDFTANSPAPFRKNGFEPIVL